MNAMILKLLHKRRFMAHPMKITWSFLKNSLNKASEPYGSFIVKGDFNTDITKTLIKFDSLYEFYTVFNSTTLINSPTCFNKTHKSTIDLILANKESWF